MNVCKLCTPNFLMKSKKSILFGDLILLFPTTGMLSLHTVKRLGQISLPFHVMLSFIFLINSQNLPKLAMCFSLVRETKEAGRRCLLSICWVIIIKLLSHSGYLNFHGQPLASRLAEVDGNRHRATQAVDEQYGEMGNWEREKEREAVREGGQWRWILRWPS